MPKAMKGNAGRTPPEPSADHSDIDDWCRHLVPDLQPIVKRLDELIRATVPGLDYAVNRKRAYYGLPELGCPQEDPLPDRHMLAIASQSCPP
jgi:hypothetical protein